MASITDSKLEPLSLRCTIVDSCGGCPSMDVLPLASDVAKRRAVERAVGISATFRAPPERWGYRTRARLHVSGGVLGFRARRTRQVVSGHCEVLHPSLSGFVNEHGQSLASEVSGGAEVHLGLGLGEIPVLCLWHRRVAQPTLFRWLEDRVERGVLAGARLFHRDRTSTEGGGVAPAEFGTPFEYIHHPFGRVRFRAGGFAQGNAAANAILVRDVAANMPPGSSVTEWYGGHGNLSLGILQHAARLVMVEQNSDACEDARWNLRGVSEGTCAIHAGDVEAHVGTLRKSNVLVVDPPRAGVGATLSVLRGTQVERVIYVSCSPKSLKRDHFRLVDLGFYPAAAFAYDLFPQTPDVEAMVVYLKRPR